MWRWRWWECNHVPSELTRSVAIGKKPLLLTPGYSVSVGGLTYNKEWDETAKWQSDTEMKSNDM